MKNFKFDLNAKVAIYVPSTTDVNIPTDNKKFVNKVMTKFSEWFGGCTSTPESFGEHFEEVYTLATEIRDEMKQEAVTLEYNGQVKFV